jgi:hypothetical protein
LFGSDLTNEAKEFINDHNNKGYEKNKEGLISRISDKITKFKAIGWDLREFHKLFIEKNYYIHNKEIYSKYTHNIYKIADSFYKFPDSSLSGVPSDLTYHIFSFLRGPDMLNMALATVGMPKQIKEYTHSNSNEPAQLEETDLLANIEYAMGVSTRPAAKCVASSLKTLYEIHEFNSDVFFTLYREKLFHY